MPILWFPSEILSQNFFTFNYICQTRAGDLAADILVKLKNK